MKRITAFIVSLTIVFSLLQVGILPVSADYSGDLIYSVVNNSTVTIDGYTGFSEEVIIPSTIDDYPVTAIAMNAFINKTINRVFLPNTLTHINTNAFRNCDGLTSISIPASVTEIGNNAFSYCSNLAKVYFLGNAPIMGSNVFLNCVSITIFRVYYQSESTGFTNPWQINITTEVFTPLAAPTLSADITTPTDSIVNVTITYQGDEAFREYRTTNSDWTPYTQPIALSANNTVYARAKNIDGTVGETASLEVNNIIFGSTEDYSYTIVNNSTISINSYLGSGGMVVIPSVIAGYPVTAITMLAFAGPAITGVVIPSTLTHIGKHAFQSCTGLTTITIPTGVTQIDEGAFSFCNNLVKVFFMGNAPTMGVNVFSYGAPTSTFRVYYQSASQGFTNPWLGNITTAVFTPLAAPSLSPSTTAPTNGTVSVTINFQGDEVYREYRITNGNWMPYTGAITLSENTVVYARAKNADGDTSEVAALTVSNIASEDLLYTFSIEDDSATIIGYMGSGGIVTIPETLGDFTVTAIADNAFKNVTTLTGIKMPDSLTTIGTWSFFGCTNLTSMAIGSNVDAIGNSAFRSCTALTEVTVPHSVTSLGESVFFGCTALTKATFGNGVTQFNYNTFYNCSNLTRVILPAGITHIQANNFYGCTSLESMVFPESTHYLGQNAFKDCHVFSNAYFMGNAPNIGNDVFDGCSADLTIHHLSDKTGFTSPWYTFTPVEFIPLPAPTIRFVTSGGEPTAHSAYVTVDFPSILPAYVTNKEYKFDNGYWTSYVGPWDLTENVTITAGYTDFDGKPSYTTTVDVDNIYHFNYTISTASEATITSYYGSDSVVPVPATLDGYPIVKIGSNAFLDRTDVTDVSLPDGLKSIGANAFDSCGLESIVIPNTVTTIEAQAFYNNQNLQNVTLPSSLGFIRDEAFELCTSLTSITIPKSVMTIGFHAFAKCSSLAEILVDADNSTYTDIDGVLFNKAETKLIAYPAGGLTEYVVPTSTTAIWSYAFSECPDLLRVTIPDTVTTIKAHAFENWDNLTIYCNAGSTAESYAISNSIPYIVTYITSAAGSGTVFDKATGFIYGLEAGITTAEFESSYIDISDGVHLEYSPDTGSLGTGTIVSIVDDTTSSIRASHTIVIFGDVNGDGAIDSIDAGILVDIENYIRTWDAQNDAAYYLAGGVNGDGAPDSIDAGMMVDSEYYVANSS